MLRRFALPTSFFVLMTCGGCFPNRAVVDPASYAPLCASKPWTPPTSLKNKCLTPEVPEPDEGDPYSLGELIDLALCINPQTKFSWAQARAAAAQYGQSQSDYFPTITGSFAYTRARVPIFTSAVNPGSLTAIPISGLTSQSLDPQIVVDDVYYSNWFPQLAVSFLVFDFGTRRATSEAARQALYNADWTHNNTILTLLQTVMDDYYSYLYQKQLFTADEADVATAKITLSAAESGLENGVRDISDYLQAKTKLLQSQTTWASQQQNVINSYAQLLDDIGLPANMCVNMQELPLKLPDSDVIPPLDTLIAISLQNRPDLMAAQANVRAQAANVTIAKTQYLPKVNYNFDIAKDYYSDGLHDKYNFTSTVSVSMPFFAGFYYRNAIKLAQANKKAADEQLQITELNIIKQVTAYHSSVKTSFETVQFATAYLDAATEEYKVALSKYKQGTNTIVDVVNAQSSLADARAREVNAFQDWYTSLANLAYATGLLSPTTLTPITPSPGVIVHDSDQVVPTHEDIK